MPIKNYTTIVPADRSIQEIQSALVKHGAVGFMLRYEQGTGRIEALTFGLRVSEQEVGFSLPVDWHKFQAVLKDQQVKRWDDEDYCYRVAWRCIRDWVLAQLALYETQMVSIPQVFLPYAVTKNGQTLFEQVANDPKLLLN